MSRGMSATVIADVVGIVLVFLLLAIGSDPACQIWTKYYSETVDQAIHQELENQ